MVGFISYAGRTSVEVTIEIYAENVLSGEKRHTNTARVTMVAIQDGKPTPVPKLICHTREEKLRFLSAKARRELRGRHLAEFDRLMADYATRSDAEIDELMSMPILGV
jgi:acyl-CoA hydrolase